MIGKSQNPLPTIFDRAVLREAAITRDPSHPLHPAFELLPSGRRSRAPRVSRSVFRKSFLPSAIQALNTVWFYHLLQQIFFYTIYLTSLLLTVVCTTLPCYGMYLCVRFLCFSTCYVCKCVQWEAKDKFHQGGQ